MKILSECVDCCACWIYAWLIFFLLDAQKIQLPINVNSVIDPPYYRHQFDGARFVEFSINTNCSWLLSYASEVEPQITIDNTNPVILRQDRRIGNEQTDLFGAKVNSIGFVINLFAVSSPLMEIEKNDL
jgi:hypothetical protein